MAVDRVRLVVHIMPPRALGDHLQRPAPGEVPAPLRTLAIPADVTDSFADVWKKIQKRDEAAYADAQRGDARYYRLQGSLYEDISLGDTLEDFGISARSLRDDLIFYMQQVANNRDMSVPLTSVLRPERWIDPRSREQGLSGRGNKRRAGEVHLSDRVGDDSDAQLRSEGSPRKSTEEESGEQEDSRDQDGFRRPRPVKRRRLAEPHRPEQSSQANDLPTATSGQTSIKSWMRRTAPASQRSAEAAPIGVDDLSDDGRFAEASSPSKRYSALSSLGHLRSPESGPQSSASTGPLQQRRGPRHASTSDDQLSEVNRPEQRGNMIDGDDVHDGDYSVHTIGERSPTKANGKTPTSSKSAASRFWSLAEDQIILDGVQRKMPYQAIIDRYKLNRTRKGIQHRVRQLKNSPPGAPAPQALTPGAKSHIPENGSSPLRTPGNPSEKQSTSPSKLWGQDEITILSCLLADGHDNVEIYSKLSHRSASGVRKKLQQLEPEVYAHARQMNTFPKDEIIAPGWTDRDSCRLRRTYREGVSIESVRKRWFHGFSGRLLEEKMAAYKAQMKRRVGSRRASNEELEEEVVQRDPHSEVQLAPTKRAHRPQQTHRESSEVETVPRSPCAGVQPTQMQRAQSPQQLRQESPEVENVPRSPRAGAQLTKTQGAFLPQQTQQESPEVENIPRSPPAGLQLTRMKRTHSPQQRHQASPGKQSNARDARADVQLTREWEQSLVASLPDGPPGSGSPEPDSDGYVTLGRSGHKIRVVQHHPWARRTRQHYAEAARAARLPDNVNDCYNILKLGCEQHVAIAGGDREEILRLTVKNRQQRRDRRIRHGKATEEEIRLANMAKHGEDEESADEEINRLDEVERGIGEESESDVSCIWAVTAKKDASDSESDETDIDRLLLDMEDDQGEAEEVADNIYPNGQDNIKSREVVVPQNSSEEIQSLPNGRPRSPEVVIPALTAAQLQSFSTEVSDDHLDVDEESGSSAPLEEQSNEGGGKQSGVQKKGKKKTEKQKMKETTTTTTTKNPKTATKKKLPAPVTPSKPRRTNKSKNNGVGSLELPMEPQADWYCFNPGPSPELGTLELWKTPEQLMKKKDTQSSNPDSQLSNGLGLGIDATTASDEPAGKEDANNLTSRPTPRPPRVNTDSQLTPRSRMNTDSQLTSSVQVPASATEVPSAIDDTQSTNTSGSFSGAFASIYSLATKWHIPMPPPHREPKPYVPPKLPYTSEDEDDSSSDSGDND